MSQSIIRMSNVLSALIFSWKLSQAELYIDWRQTEVKKKLSGTFKKCLGVVFCFNQMRTVTKYEHNSVWPLPCVRKISIWHIGNVFVFRFPTSVLCQDICDRPHGLQRPFGSTWKKHYCIASGSVIHSSNYKKQGSLLVCACHDLVCSEVTCGGFVKY